MPFFLKRHRKLDSTRTNMGRIDKGHVEKGVAWLKNAHTSKVVLKNLMEVVSAIHLKDFSMSLQERSVYSQSPLPASRLDPSLHWTFVVHRLSSHLSFFQFFYRPTLKGWIIFLWKRLFIKHLQNLVDRFRFFSIPNFGVECYVPLREALVTSGTRFEDYFN